MKRFFLGNGFEKIIDEKDYESPQFRSTWGVSDNDLFRKAHEYFSENQDRPFFSLIFTSSNHSPFEVPDMPEGFYPETGRSVKNAVKYADYALGRFFERAKKSNYWENTVFLIVADHNSRVYGDQLIPVERFRIPGLIIGGGIKPDIYKNTVSQIDLPPSLLSIAGLSGYTPMPGNNIFGSREKNFSGRAILQFYKNQAYLFEDGRLIVLQPGKIAEEYTWTGQSLKRVDTDNAFADKALAFALWTYWQYDKTLYRKDKTDFIAKEIENETAHCRR
jgi:phosphoglycerol transferase MdoB-like AlkP superfamily enzyme